jgi:hypothetical protein
MNQQTHTARIAEMTIHRLIESLFQLFTHGRTSNGEVIKLKDKKQMLDTNNPDYTEIIEDRRENMKMYWRVLIIFLSIGVDFLLSFQAMTILCEEFSLPEILKFIVPAFLIAVEIGISYFQILNQRIGEHSSWLVRNAQYLVLLILTGLTILVIIFSIQMYNTSSDGMSFLAYLAGTVLLQTALLVASIMLHLWLIRNAEAIAETLAYFHYKIDRNNLVRKINRLERKNKKKYVHAFAAGAYKLVQKIEFFKQEYPGANINFTKTMPASLATAINQVMGKDVFIIEKNAVA